jgi:hypothetical protein
MLRGRFTRRDALFRANPCSALNAMRMNPLIGNACTLCPLLYGLQELLGQAVRRLGLTLPLSLRLRRSE